jgi:hypothetical protein
MISDYLAAFPDTPGKMMVAGVVCLVEDRREGGWTRFMDSIGLAQSVRDLFDQPIRKLQQQYQESPRLRVKVLPRLVSPEEAHVRHWRTHDLVEPFIDVTEKEITAMFQGRKSLPMDDLYFKLRDLLEQAQINRGGGRV